MAIMKLWLIVSGIYVWEFVTTLDFEWSMIRRYQCYRWTIWIYSFSRLSGLVVVIIFLVGTYDTSPINCQAWVTFSWAFSALGGYGLSSILIMLRIFAIWDKSKVIMAISAAIWVINLGFQLTGKLTSSIPRESQRIRFDIRFVLNGNFYINLLATDVILLLIMLAGLLRLRRSPGGSFYLSHLLWKQGVIWLAIATAAELPQVLLLFLDLNDSLNLLFLLPSMVTIIIAATRTYRSLIHSASPPDFHLDEPDSPNLNLQKTERQRCTGPIMRSIRCHRPITMARTPAQMHDLPKSH
ncbi:hypothetical protein F5888DRAFT_1906747, partial [Russula emetica]